MTGVAILAQLAGIDGPGAANEAVRLGAARELLDRGFGRPLQAIAGDDEAPPVSITFRWADADDEAPPVSITFRWADAVQEQQPETELDDAAVEAGAALAFGETC